MANSSGLMAGVIGASGLTENSMAKEPILQVKAKKNMENGETAKGLDG